MPLLLLVFCWTMGLNAFQFFMTSFKSQGPEKQFWTIKMKLSKPFRRQRTHYAEKLLHELISNIHWIYCPATMCWTKVRPLTSCVISLSKYISSMPGMKYHWASCNGLVYMVPFRVFLEHPTYMLWQFIRSQKHIILWRNYHFLSFY